MICTIVYLAGARCLRCRRRLEGERMSASRLAVRCVASIPALAAVALAAPVSVACVAALVRVHRPRPRGRIRAIGRVGATQHPSRQRDGCTSQQRGIHTSLWRLRNCDRVLPGRTARTASARKIQKAHVEWPEHQRQRVACR